MKRKLLCVVLALLTLLALSVPALADDVPEIEIEWLNLPGMPWTYIPETDSFFVKNSDGKYGIVERSTGKMIVPCEYDDYCLYSDGLAAVSQTDANGVQKYGFIDTNGQLVLPVQYEIPEFFYSIFSFSEGLAVIAKTENGVTKYGYINTEGEIVIPVEYDDANPFSEGYAAVRKGEVNSYIDYNENSFFEFSHYLSSGCCFYDFHDGVALIWQGNDSFSFINTDFEVLSTFNLPGSHYAELHNGMLIAESDNGKEGCIDIYGNWAIPAEYDNLYYIDDDLILAGLDGKYGYLDDTGEIVIPIDYDSVSWYSYDNLLAVGKNDSEGVLRKGVINKAGEIVLPLEYDSIRLMERYVAVELDGKYGLFESPYYISDEPVEEEPEAIPEEIPEEAPAEELPAEEPAEEIPTEDPISEPESQPVASEPVAEEAETSYLLPVLLAVGLVIAGVLVFVLLKKKKAAK